MGERMQNISGLFSNLRTRNIIILTGVILLLVIVVGVVGLSRPSGETASGAAVGSLPSIDTTPGLTEVSPQVRGMVQTLDDQRYDEAKQTSGSAFPTLLLGDGGGESGEKPSIFDVQDAAADKQAENKPSVPSGKPLSIKEVAAMEQAKQQVADVAPTAAQQNVQGINPEAIEQARQQAVQNMQNQTKALMAAWSGDGGTAVQYYQEARAPVVDETAGQVGNGADGGGGATANGGNGTDQPQGPVIIKAGDIIFGVLNTAVNTDEPGPVLATVVTGEYKGSRLVGGLQDARDVPGTNGPTAVTISFNTMSMPDADKSMTVEAVAIDPDTARTALASDVDAHYFMRYGSLFASAFLEGYGNSITQAGSITINDPSGGSTEFKQKLTPKEEFFAGLGTVGQRWGQEIGDVFNRPNTIVVDAGVSIGILFTDDVIFDVVRSDQTDG